MTTSPGSILMYWAGGLEWAGGIGRMAGNLLHARAAAGRPETVLRLDTRGPRWILLAPAYLAIALLRTVLTRISGSRVMAHVHMADSGSTIRKVIVCRLLALLNIPYLLHLHPGNYDTYFRSLPDWGKRRVRRAFANAAVVVALGECWRQLVVEEIGVVPARVRIIPNGVPDPGPPATLAHDGIPTILFLGEFAQWKGLAELIAALGTLRDRSWRLVCAGRGEWGRSAADAAGAGIAERIEFLGWVDRAESAALMRAASIVAVPSHIEGFSVTLIEALAGGVAVVATAVGAHPDVLRDRKNAMVVPPRDVPALAAALATLLDEPARRAAIAAAGRATFKERLDITLIEARFAELYAETMPAAPSRRLARVRLTAHSGHESIR